MDGAHFQHHINSKQLGILPIFLFSSIERHGGGTALRVGMDILKINNTDCSVLSADAGMKLMEKEGMVTILARKKQLPPGFLITAVIDKT